MKILIVDDDAAISELLLQILHHVGGHEVAIAASARQALLEIEMTGQPFDCILLDIQMPEMDGVELCRVLRQKEDYRKVPIVMLTAMSDRGYLDRAFQNGATDYIQKPFDVEDLGIRLRIAAKLAKNQSFRREDTKETGQTEKERSRIRSPFEDVVPIDDIPKLVNYSTFKTYVLALPIRLGLTTSAVGVRITGLREIYAEVSQIEFRKILQLSADCLSSAQAEQSPLFTYTGSGIFLILRTKNDAFYEDELARSFAEKVYPIAAEFAGTYLANRLRVQIGAPARLWTLRRADRVIPLKKAILEFEKKRSVTTNPSEELERRSDRSEYADLLRNFQDDNTELLPLNRATRRDRG